MRPEANLRPPGATEALRASPKHSLRPGRSSPLSSAGGEKEETQPDTINPNN